MIYEFFTVFVVYIYWLYHSKRGYLVIEDAQGVFWEEYTISSKDTEIRYVEYTYETGVRVEVNGTYFHDYDMRASFLIQDLEDEHSSSLFVEVLFLDGNVQYVCYNFSW